MQEAKSNLEITIAKTTADLAKAKRKLETCKSAIPYDLQSEINAHADVKSLEDGLAYAKTVLAERF